MASREEMLTKLHSSPAHNDQINAWEADMEAFEELKTDCEDELRRMQSEAYQVASWYAAFQMVIFAAVSQASLLTCELRWCPVSLSLSVSIAAFLAIADKLYSMGEVKEDINEANRNITAIVECLDLVLQVEGADSNLETLQPRQELPRAEHAGCRNIISKGGVSALLFLASISAIIVSFSNRTLCVHCLPCAY